MRPRFTAAIGLPADAAACGTICYEAFKSVCMAHGFPPDFPSPEVATGLMSMLLAHPGFYSVVAEVDGRIAGSNFLDERASIAGVGPITVDPTIMRNLALISLPAGVILNLISVGVLIFYRLDQGSHEANLEALRLVANPAPLPGGSGPFTPPV